jgi:hypothetical protein
MLLNGADAVTGLNPSYLRTLLASFPTSDPYAAAPYNTVFTHVNNATTATINSSILATTGNNAIVDWVFIELRTGVSGATTVAYTKSALLQADGNVVATDGVSKVSMSNVPVGNYYIAIRHRNHLGIRTLNTVALSNTSSLTNFTTGSVALYGVSPYTIIAANLYALNGADADFDGSIDALDSSLWETQNGSFDDYTSNSDYNMDGSVDALDSAIWEFNNGKYQELD